MKIFLVFSAWNQFYGETISKYLNVEFIYFSQKRWNGYLYDLPFEFRFNLVERHKPFNLTYKIFSDVYINNIR